MALPMSNLEKAAGMLVCLGIDRAAQVLAFMAPEDVQMLAGQMARTGRINGSTRSALIEELRKRYTSAELESATGGVAFVQRLLAELFGEERAAAVLEQLTETTSSRPFMRLRSVEAHRILDLISAEHPSIIALVLYYLPREKAAQVMAGLPDAVRHEVVMRLVNLQTPMPQMVSRLEQLLTQRLSDIRGDDEDGEREVGAVSGSRALVEILGRANPTVERRVFEFLQERDPELAEEVRKSMFVFEDIATLDQRALQTVLREVASQEIALALKSASDELRTLVFSNVSENASKIIKEELSLLGPVRVSQVEEAQQKVVSVVRRLAQEGVIMLRGAGAEEEIIE